MSVIRPEDYERLVERFTRRAEARATSGSRARSDHPADEWDDLDIMALDDPTRSFQTLIG
jgi:hypothetical protein